MEHFPYNWHDEFKMRVSNLITVEFYVFCLSSQNSQHMLKVYST